MKAGGVYKSKNTLVFLSDLLFTPEKTTLLKTLSPPPLQSRGVYIYFGPALLVSCSKTALGYSISIIYIYIMTVASLMCSVVALVYIYIHHIFEVPLYFLTLISFSSSVD